jgi:iron complex outermembrane recepter protein
MLKSFLFAASLLCSLHSFAQYSLKGTIRDLENQEYLAGATIEVEGQKVFAISDERGRFYLTRLKEGPAQLLIRFVGYAPKTVSVSIPSDAEIDIQLNESTILTEEVIVRATRANENTPSTFSNVDKQTIVKQNFGQDLPYLLNWTTSLVTTSDAGTGFGYTGVRIRGSDATSINVTINGIPYNDSESLGTFWVDIPDIASSSESIQIQRGVGSSSNGAGAFGATINLQTNIRNDYPYAAVTNSVGFLGPDGEQFSYNSRRHTVGFGTGVINNHWVIDGRFSKIYSNGFIDRATADLNSYYMSAGFYSGKTMVKFMTFGGKERTYQSWYGVPESRLHNDQEAMLTTASNEGWNEEQTANLLTSDSRTFNPYTYQNQVDDYRQDHFQLHLSQRFNEAITGNVAFHYTPGKGFYEEFKPKDEFSDYGLQPVLIGDSLIEVADFIRRRWLDNDFYGLTYSFNFKRDKTDLTLGGGLNRYDGKHFGEIIWAEVATVPMEYNYYNSTSHKTDFNIFQKLNYNFTEKLNGYLDIQYRYLFYETKGIDNGGSSLDIAERFDFLNPKIGLLFSMKEGHQLYSSFSIANREPVRSDFINAPLGKKPTRETLYNVEAGYRIQNKRYTLQANYYYMSYRDQLIHTGQVNDVGSPIRTNVDKSFRSGIELEGLFQLSSRFFLNTNVTLSRNKILDFTEVLYDYGVDWDEYKVVERKYKNTDIAFSPATISAAGLTYRARQGFEVTWLSKFVSRQYLDNTANKLRSLDPYFINDVRLSYAIQPSFAKEITLSLLANNIFNVAFESNGYTWGYAGGGTEYRENYYYPQAGRNFMAMLSLRF